MTKLLSEKLRLLLDRHQPLVLFV